MQRRMARYSRGPAVRLERQTAAYWGADAPKTWLREFSTPPRPEGMPYLASLPQERLDAHLLCYAMWSCE